MNLCDAIHRAAESVDCLFLGIVSLETKDAFSRYIKWLDEKSQGGMKYLEENQSCRQDPTRLLKGARNAIIVALPYNQRDTWPVPPSTNPRIAQYARFADYHKLLRNKCESIVTALRSITPFDARIAVDSAPLLEKALAEKTSLGFLGKNTCYIHPQKGSFLLLAEILTTLDLPLDEKTPVDPYRHTDKGGCGKCDRCQVHCPTGALAKDYSIDANLCLAYWTIEHRGPIPEKFWPWMGEYYFGCDICQLVCPYNKNAEGTTLPASVSLRKFPTLFETAIMTQSQYENYFGGTPLTRAKRNGLRRNALIAMTVRKDPLLEEALLLAAQDPGGPVGRTLEQIRGYRSLHFRHCEEARGQSPKGDEAILSESPP